MPVLDATDGEGIKRMIFASERSCTAAHRLMD
jgi:hypothetical protein